VRLRPQPGPCYARGVSRTFRLLALLAPGSIEAEVGALQQAVFAEHGFVSAIALPPIVPVRFVLVEAPTRLPQVPGREVPTGFAVRTTGSTWGDGHLFLGLDTGGAWHALRSDERWSDGPALVPCFEGFFIGCGEAPPEVRDSIAAPAMDLKFSSIDIALLTIVVPDEGTAWWSDVRWQIEERRPLRGKRSA
jgi:hypothetical protein